MLKHGSKKPGKVFNNIRPVRGMCLNIYTYRTDIGSGTRNVIIVGLSPRYVTLFYAPKLYSFKVKRKEWGTVPAVEYECSTQWLIDAITRSAQEHDKYAMRYSKVTVARALEVLRKRLKIETEVA